MLDFKDRGFTLEQVCPILKSLISGTVCSCCDSLGCSSIFVLWVIREPTLRCVGKAGLPWL